MVQLFLLPSPTTSLSFSVFSKFFLLPFNFLEALGVFNAAALFFKNIDRRHENIDSTSKFLHATIFHHQAVAVGEDRREGFVVADNDNGHIGTLLVEGVIELLPV